MTSSIMRSVFTASAIRESNADWGRTIRPLPESVSPFPGATRRDQQGQREHYAQQQRARDKTLFLLIIALGLPFLYLLGQSGRGLAVGEEQGG